MLQFCYHESLSIARFENYTSEKHFIVKCYYDGKLKLAVLILDFASRL